MSLGLGFSLCARDRLRADGPFAAPAFVIVLAFVAVVLAPVTLYLYWAHPAWTWMYAVDPDGVPGLALLPLVFAHGGAVVLGWYVGARLFVAGRAKAVVYGAGGGALVALLGTLIFWGRLGRYGSYDEFHAGRDLALMEVKLGYVLVAMAVGVGGAAAYTAVELLRDSRRVRAR